MCLTSWIDGEWKVVSVCLDCEGYTPDDDEFEDEDGEDE